MRREESECKLSENKPLLTLVVRPFALDNELLMARLFLYAGPYDPLARTI
jgi:hypothetical protein